MGHSTSMRLMVGVRAFRDRLACSSIAMAIYWRSFALEYEIRPNTALDPEKVERQNRERLIPTVLEGLKHYVETDPPKEAPCQQ